MKTELYSIIKSPYLTEKVSTLMGESNQYAFKVDINATKLQVKKAIAGFKLREGLPVGVKVTLRKKVMYEFIDRLINIALPRVRDFRGLNKKSFDGKGNYAFGIKEHIIFPEINYESVTDIWGMDVVILHLRIRTKKL